MGSPEGGVIIFGRNKDEARFKALEDRVSTVEHELKSARLDWLDLYAKAKRLFGRVAKAQEREEARETAEANGAGGPEAAVPTSLSPRAQLIQRQILARRQAMGIRNREGGE